MSCSVIRLKLPGNKTNESRSINIQLKDNKTPHNKVQVVFFLMLHVRNRKVLRGITEHLTLIAHTQQMSDLPDAER